MPRDDGLFTGNVRAGLMQLREKLLDLTTRNRLLNFKHTPRSSVRLIDELPDVIFDRLSNGDNKFSFIPVQRLSRRERLEYEADFRTDHDLNPTEDVPEPDVLRVAIMRGLDTNFEMPFPSSDDAPEKHVDSKIQTLLYPEDLEAGLSNLYRQARLAIEETGVNFLHLAIGYLEWQEPNRPEKKNHAPLLLLPVYLERGGVNAELGIRQFSIGPSGEDVRDNISLRMKLDQMGLALPEIEDEEGNAKNPERLFKECANLLKAKPEWKLKRYVTLSMFQFGKMVMFEDLHPDRWGQSLFEHPIIKKFFEGNPREAESTTETYPDLDSAPKMEAFPIIEDADSSQHSALVDAIKGENLVIEGPPGTGKSQTITNLIAASLNAGKTVLFVSEKMAALDVVKRRLDGAGLGHFCLELHSHKTQKTELINDVRQRLDLKDQFTQPRRIDRTLERLEATRTKIKSYSELLNRHWGQIDHTVQEIFAEAVRYRAQLSFELELLSDVRIGEPSQVRDVDIDDIEIALRSFVTSFNKVFKDRSSSKGHPLQGIRRADLDELDYPKFWRSLQAHIESISILIEKLSELPGMQSDSAHATIQYVKDLISRAAALPSPTPDELPAWLSNIESSESEIALTTFIKDVRKWRNLSLNLRQIIADPHAAEPAIAQRLIDLASAPHVTPLLQLDENRLAELISKLKGISAMIRRAEEGFRNFTDSIGVDIQPNRNGIEIAAQILSIVAESPITHLHLRTDELRADTADEAISIAEKKIETVNELQDRLASKLDLSIAPELPEAKKAVRTLQSAGFLGFLNGAVRQSRRDFNSIWTGSKNPTKSERLTYLRRLVNFLEQTDELNKDSALRSALGPHFTGTGSPLAEMKLLRNWYKDLSEKLGTLNFGDKTLTDHIWRTDGSKLSSLRTQVSKENSSLRAIIDLDAALRDEVFTDVEFPVNEANFAMLMANCDKRLQAAQMLAELRHGFGVKGSCLGTDAVTAASEFKQWVQMASKIEANEMVGNILSNVFRGTETDLALIERGIALKGAIMRCALPAEMTAYLLTDNSTDRFVQFGAKFDEITDSVRSSVKKIDEFKSLVDLDTAEWIGDSLFKKSLSEVLERARQVPLSNDLLRDWIDHLQRLRRLEELGVREIASLVSARTLESDFTRVRDAFLARLYDAMAGELMETHEELRGFRSEDFEALRERYAYLDNEILDLQRQKIAATLDQRVVPPGVSAGRVRDLTEQALLDHIKNQARPRITIRQILSRAATALQALKPCFMMSPLSVAQYIDPGRMHFDLIVMDEASQMKPEDALGSIGRADQIVIVGDSKQLPPTSFFDRVFAEDRDDEGAYVAVESESILEVAASLFQPSRQLNWHYRSRHESLIAFSNDRFYSNQLIVFPSPKGVGENLGVSLQYIDYPSYKSGRNLNEARAVAAAALKHMESGTTDSLGVVAINKEQADLIDSEIETLLKRSPNAEDWRNKRDLEPLIVKNLENIQGDERDVIFISFTYGPETVGGPVAQRFGPILSPTGWRRLNVLFTRARKRILVFSSMKPSDIAEKPGRMGPTAMRDFIRYAETRRLDRVTLTGKAPDSAFEVAVANSLANFGFNCEAQVGAAGYFIDIGIRDPDRPEEFIAGIECDGAPWHSGKSVRDRDRIRQSVLEGLGWSIIRIWSTDWYRHPEREMERVLEELEKLQLRAGRKRQFQQAQDLVSKGPETTSLDAASRRAPTHGTQPTSSRFHEGESVFGEETISEHIGSPSLDPQLPTEHKEHIKFGISVEEARRELIELRERELRKTFPNSDASRSLLRREMIDAFLRFRPTTQDEFKSLIPYNLRVNTDGKQANMYLDRILGIIEEIGD